VGIPKEKIDTILILFLKTISTIKENLGTWLGLFIVKTLVDMQEGIIKMESVVGKGTSCIITLDFDIIESGRTEVLSSEPLFMIWAAKLS
jgi:signal transduction histidine kinase